VGRCERADFALDPRKTDAMISDVQAIYLDFIIGFTGTANALATLQRIRKAENQSSLGLRRSIKVIKGCQLLDNLNQYS
jgi:hypothetical protein